MTPPVAPAARCESLLLWRTWRQAGLAALQRNDFAAAVAWLDEALCHLCQGGPHDLQHAMTQAEVAYAQFRFAEQQDVCANDECLSEVRRQRAAQRAKQARAAACSCAEVALPRLPVNDASAEVQLDRARAAFVLAHDLLGNDDLVAAAKCFAVAREALRRSGIRTPLIEEVLQSIFQVNYRAESYDAALEAAVELDLRLVAHLSKRSTRAWIVAGRADLLMLTGRYREADDLYPTWQQIWRRLDDDQRRTSQTAYGQAVFGRTRISLGHYDDANDLLCAARDTLSCLAKCDEGRLLDVLLSQADVAEKLGDFSCSLQRLCAAEELLVPAEKKFGRYVAPQRVRFCLIAARRWLSLGQFAQARACFESARRTAEQEAGCKYFYVAPAILGLARIESEQSQHAAAIDLVHCALQHLEQAGATTSAEMALALHELAFAYIQAGKSDEAQPVCESAILLLGMALRSGHPEEAAMRLTLAQSLAANHRSERALDEVGRVRAILQDSLPCRAYDAARAMRVEAEINHARRSFSCALGALRCARNIWLDAERCLAIVHPERSILALEIAAIHAHNNEAALISQALADDDFVTLACIYKGAHERVGFEVNRRANLLFEHGLYAEAAWEYGLAAEHYTLGCGPDHAYTTSARANQQLALNRYSEPEPAEACACSPDYIPCTTADDSPCRCPPVCISGLEKGGPR